jgi:hypothetical protein
MKSDDVTSKKLSMDVARLLIRTSCQNPVDEFIDVKVNGVIFHLRILEDSYGPMRIMLPQSKGTDGRDQGSNCSEEEEEEEEEERRLMEVEEEVEETEAEGEGDNLLALNSMVNANNVPLLSCDQNVLFLNDKEGNKDNSNVSINVLNKENLNSDEGDVLVDGNIPLEDRVEETGGIELGQGAGEGGPILSINSNQAVKGGASSKELFSDLGRAPKPNLKEGEVEGCLEGRKGGVYSNGPSGVYKLLNKSPLPVVSSSLNQCSLPKKGKATFPTIPPSASLRRQQLMAKSLSARNSHSNSTNASVPSIHTPSTSTRLFRGEAEKGPSLEAGVTRGSVEANQLCSSSSLDSKLVCSSINSTDIRNCNNRFLKNFEQEVVSKVWNGALQLGVVCNPLGEREDVEISAGLEAVCLKEIQENEKRDAVGKVRREQLKSCDR